MYFSNYYFNNFLISKLKMQMKIDRIKLSRSFCRTLRKFRTSRTMNYVISLCTFYYSQQKCHLLYIPLQRILNYCTHTYTRQSRMYMRICTSKRVAVREENRKRRRVCLGIGSPVFPHRRRRSLARFSGANPDTGAHRID